MQVLIELQNYESILHDVWDGTADPSESLAATERLIKLILDGTLDDE